MGKKAIKYSEAINELNSMLSDLESENIDIDEISQKVKRAVELIQVCKNKIRNAEMEVKKIVKDFEKETASRD